MEEWRQIFLGNLRSDYEVSTTGRVRRAGASVDLIQERHRTGYRRVMLYTHRGRERNLVHRLVASAFIPADKDRLFVNHRDGRKSNNCVENLEWCTRRENAEHAILLGLQPRGTRNKAAKLDNESVRIIRQLHKYGGMSHDAIAVPFGVSKATIGRIVRQQTWSHVPR